MENDEFVIEIRDAVRDKARVVVGISGVSGSGKTHTALLMALGLAGYDPRKVGMLDCENRRGSLYSDVLRQATRPTDKPFRIADLFAPFSPSRYCSAIEAFQRAGVEVLVIDSASHEWEGLGGCEDIAHAGNPRNPQWNRAKAEHKRFMNKLLQCDMHIIVCLRARDKVKLVKVGNKTEYESIGVQPIQEKNFMFELTVSMMMWNSGKNHEMLKCPGELVHVFEPQGYLNDTHGAAIRSWIDGGQATNGKVERFRNALQSNAERGVAYIEECWAKVPADIQRELGDTFKASLVASAKAHDELREMGGDDDPHAQQEGVAGLNAELDA